MSQKLINSQHFSHLALLNQSLTSGIHEYHRSRGLTYIDVPEMVGITGAHGQIDSLFRIQNRYDLPLFFIQTSQFSLEQALQFFPGIYTIINSSRDTETEDERHLRQFKLTEIAFDCTAGGMTEQTYTDDKMFGELLRQTQQSARSMVKTVIKHNIDLLKTTYKQNVSRLETIVTSDYKDIEYTDAIKLLNMHGYSDISFGDELKTAHEMALVKLTNRQRELPIFITKYPKELKFFNRRIYEKDSRIVLSADLIFPLVGKVASAAVKEHDFGTLNDRLLASDMYRVHRQKGGSYEDFAWYLNLMKSKKIYPHAGYGIGNARMLQYMIGESDIRNASVFFILNQETGDWDRNKYGKAAIVSTENKHILLSLSPKAKKILLPYLKKLGNRENFVLYATKKTHSFLSKHAIKASLVYKISEVGKEPNIANLLARRVFDLIINTPTQAGKRGTKELTDGTLIRKGALDLGILLVTAIDDAKKIIANITKQPFYDPEKTYQFNYDFGPFETNIENTNKIVQKHEPQYSFLGHKVYLPFGIPAGPLLNSAYVKYAFKQEFDIAVYKTVRSEYFPCHPFPNILPLKIDGDLTLEKMKNELTTDIVYKNRMSITNSFGVPSKDPTVWQEDVKNAVEHQKKGQLMILSFMGTVKKNQTRAQFINDYVLAAQLAKETGAKALEMNLSCPNIGNEGLVCYNLEMTATITALVRKAIGNIPLILKIGYYKDESALLKLAEVAAEYANGIAAINTLQTVIVDKFSNQALPGKMRLASGVCGAAIKWAGIDMVSRLQKIREKYNYNYEIIGVGGVIEPQDYFDYKKAGADCVMSATGAMWNPNLAQEIKQLIKH